MSGKLIAELVRHDNHHDARECIWVLLSQWVAIAAHGWQFTDYASWLDLDQCPCCNPTDEGWVIREELERYRHSLSGPRRREFVRLLHEWDRLVIYRQTKRWTEPTHYW